MERRRSAADRGSGRRPEDPRRPEERRHTASGADPAATVRPRAVVTGASSGIGAAFARELAAVGYDLVLVARRTTLLESLADELEEAHGVAVEVRGDDLATAAGAEALARHLGAMEELDLFVSNAGFGTSTHFAHADLRRQVEMVRLHVEASVRLTHAALERMVPRRRGGIIHVSSIAAFLPRPGNATYASTKAFLNSFVTALAAELRGTGVRVQALCPGFTRTGFHDTPDYVGFHRSQIPRFLWMSPGAVARVSLRSLRGERVIVIPGWWNRLIVWMTQHGLTRKILLLPRFRARGR